MYARAVDEAAVRLRELRHEQWQDFALAALTVGLALVATQAHPEVALPLFLGGLAVAAFGVRALWRRWDLVDRLAGERDAYLISEVRAHATRESAMERRRSFAAAIRRKLEQPGPRYTARVVAVAEEELEELAAELDDDELALDPACAVACIRLVTNLSDSPLHDPALPPEDLRSYVRQIRSGFRSRRLPG